MSEDDKKEGLFKRIKNIENKNLTQLQAIKDQGEKQLKELKNIDNSKTLKAIDEIRRKNDETNKSVPNFKKSDRTLDKAELVCTKTDGTKYDFNRFALPLKIWIKELRFQQIELRILINKLNIDYNPRIPNKAKEKNRVLESARKLPDAKDDIIDLFKKGIFPYKDNAFKTTEEESEEESEKESEENKLEKIKDDHKTFIRCIEDESKGINYDLFKDYFSFIVPSALPKKLYETKDKKKNNKLAELIKNRCFKRN